MHLFSCLMTNDIILDRTEMDKNITYQVSQRRVLLIAPKIVFPEGPTIVFWVFCSPFTFVANHSQQDTVFDRILDSGTAILTCCIHMPHCILIVFKNVNYYCQILTFFQKKNWLFIADIPSYSITTDRHFSLFRSQRNLGNKLYYKVK